MHTTALSSSFLFFTPSYARSFISMLMQRKRRGRGYFDKRNAGGFSNVHTADSCYFWELGDVFVRSVRSLTVHCLDTFGVYFTTRTCVERRWISIFFFFFFYLYFSFRRLIFCGWFKRIKFENKKRRLLFLFLELNVWLVDDYPGQV